MEEWLKETRRAIGQNGTAPRTPECEPFPRRKEGGSGAARSGAGATSGASGSRGGARD